MTLHSDVLNCRRCKLRDGARAPVPPSGTPGDIAFVGEAPGRTENDIGIPFSGASGQMLRRIIAETTFITDPYFVNVAACWPGPGNPDPPVYARAACRPHLLRAVAGAKVIVTLGAVALSAFAPAGTKIGKVRGRPFATGPFVIVPTYHPAAAMHGDPGITDWIALDIACAYGLSRNPGEWPAPEPIQYSLT